MKTYGKELIIDLHQCDPKTFNRKSLKKRSFLKLFLLAGVISVSDAIDGMHRFVILPDEDNRAFPLFSRYGRSHGCGQGADAAF